MNLINKIKDKLYERKWLKSKPCAACHYFMHYMSSAGVCTAKTGCPASRLKDYSDTCDCNEYKKKRGRYY